MRWSTTVLEKRRRSGRTIYQVMSKLSKRVIGLPCHPEHNSGVTGNGVHQAIAVGVLMSWAATRLIIVGIVGRPGGKTRIGLLHQPLNNHRVGYRVDMCCQRGELCASTFPWSASGASAPHKIAHCWNSSSYHQDRNFRIPVHYAIGNASED